MALNPPTSLTSFTIPVILLSISMVKSIFGMFIYYTYPSYPKKWISQPLYLLVEPDPILPLVTFTILFQKSRSTLPWYVSMNCSKMIETFLTYFFRRPSRSNYTKLWVLVNTLFRSSRVPPKCTFWIPQNVMLLP